ncbi:MAG TPA: metallophosphoesterase family protein [Gaiellaceae bacterium]
MRVAALYDIHGNVQALDAVLAEVDADVIVIGGDTVMGPMPSETLERVRALEGDVRVIRGNADREVYEDEPGLAPHEAFEYARSRLSEEQLDYLRALPLTVSIGRVLFCHATPRNDEEILTKISPDERWREALAGVDADVVVCGHTHVQFDRRIGDIRLVNAGSVGMPYEHEPGAYWALLDGTDVELRHTRCQAPDVSAWPGEWPQATPEEATEHFERMSRGEA